MKVTIFHDESGLRCKRLHISARDFAGRIGKITRPSKAQLPYVKFASFGSERSAKRSLRHNANVRKVEGLEADYDDGEKSIAWTLAKLDDADIAAFVVPTASHRPDAPRYRIYCPFSEPLEPEERAKHMARLNGVLGGVLAVESFTLSQSYYFGAVEGQEAPRVEMVEGRAIDLADDLDAGALDKHGRPWGQRVTPETPDDSDDDDMVRTPDFERIKRALERVPSADYVKHWLPVGMALHHEFDGSEDGFELWDEWSQSSGNYDADKVREKWASFGTYSGRPTTIATLFGLAGDPRPASTGELTFHSPAECAVAPPRGYVWKGVLAPGDIASIFGAPGAGKSLIAPHVGYMTALGETVFASRTKPGRVFYVAAEDATGLRQRVAALRLRHGDAPDFSVVGGVSDLFDEHSADLGALLEAVEELRPKLIVIDTLAMAFPGLEENDAKSMGRVVAVARQLAQHGAAVVLVHHDTKADGSTPRGHSVLHGALDMALHVKRGEDGIVRGVLRKNRNGSPDCDIAFRIGTEDLGTDEDGDPITAALVEELPASGGEERVRLTGAENAALAKLIELEADGRVSEDGWRAACVAERKVSGAEDTESRKRAMRRAVQALARKGMIETRDGMVAVRHEITLGEEE